MYCSGENLLTGQMLAMHFKDLAFMEDWQKKKPLSKENHVKFCFYLLWAEVAADVVEVTGQMRMNWLVYKQNGVCDRKLKLHVTLNITKHWKQWGFLALLQNFLRLLWAKFKVEVGNTPSVALISHSNHWQVTKLFLIQSTTCLHRSFHLTEQPAPVTPPLSSCRLATAVSAHLVELHIYFSVQCSWTQW